MYVICIDRKNVIAVYNIGINKITTCIYIEKDCKIVKEKKIHIIKIQY